MLNYIYFDYQLNIMKIVKMHLGTLLLVLALLMYTEKCQEFVNGDGNFEGDVEADWDGGIADEPFVDLEEDQAVDELHKEAVADDNVQAVIEEK